MASQIPCKCKTSRLTSSASSNSKTSWWKRRTSWCYNLPTPFPLAFSRSTSSSWDLGWEWRWTASIWCTSSLRVPSATSLPPSSRTRCLWYSRRLPFWPKSKTSSSNVRKSHENYDPSIKIILKHIKPPISLSKPFVIPHQRFMKGCWHIYKYVYHLICAFIIRYNILRFRMTNNCDL